MQTTLLLARSASVRNGLIDAEGLGWSTTSTTGPMAVVVFVSVPAHLAGRHEVAIELHDKGGDLIAGPTTDSAVPVPIRAEAQFTANPNPHVPSARETTTLVCVSWQEGELPLEPGNYEWHLSLDGSPLSVTQFNVVDLHELRKQPFSVN